MGIIFTVPEFVPTPCTPAASALASASACSNFTEFQLFPLLEGTFQPLGCRVDVPLRDANATVACNPHDSEGVGSSFPKPGQHGVP